MARNDGIVWTFTRTIFYFLITLMLTPAALVTFAAVALSSKLIVLLLSKRFKYLEFARTNTVRSLVDTSRNPGILHFLVKVKGQCNIDKIKEAYQLHLLDKRERNKKLCYPRLKLSLITCWSQYAWVKNFDEFNINNHIKLCSSLNKGVEITEDNIQESISHLISRYMPADFPPWQIKIIPMKHSYYMLIRIHHLILDEQKNLNVCDMMLLDGSKGSMIASRFTNYENNPMNNSPLKDLVLKPKNFEMLYKKITMGIKSRWNEFVYNNESLDYPDVGMKKTENFSELCSTTVMLLFNVYLDYNQRVVKATLNSSDPLQKFRFLVKLMKEEYEKRHLSLGLIFEIILKTLNPIHLVKEFGKFMWWSCITWIFLSPFYFYREMEGIRNAIMAGPEILTNSTYIPLLYGAMKEFFYYLNVTINAPRLIIDEMFKSDGDSHCLQNLTLCGRKVISWSKPIRVEHLSYKAEKNHQTQTEVLLATLSDCLLNFFRAAKKETEELPGSIQVNYRSIPYEYLFGTKSNKNGLLCLKLPIQEVSVKQMMEIHDEIEQTRKRQIVPYILSLLQVKHDLITNMLPAVLLKVIINFLSQKFSVTFTEVLEFNVPELAEYVTLWNGEIEDVLYFRTPQANNSLSLTIQRFKNQIRLLVMCDKLINPLQFHLSDSFCKSFDQIPQLKTPAATLL